MTAPSGLSAQLMLAEESTYGTFVTPARAWDLVSETLQQKIDRIESKGLRGGRRVLTSQQWVPGKVVVAGDLMLEPDQVSFGVFWKHALGTVVTSGSSGVGFTHTCTPGDLTGKSLTVQVGRPDITGVIRPFSYTGCKVNQWELSCKAGELANLKVALVAQAESTAQTLGKPYYSTGTRSVSDGATNSNTTVTSATAAFTQADVNAPISGGSIPAAATIVTVTNATTVTISAAAGSTATNVTLVIGAPAMGPLVFVQGLLQIGGSEVDVKDLVLKGNNGLDANRFFVRPSGQLIKEPLEQAWRTWDGTLTADFTDLTLYARYTSGAEATLVLTFTGGVIPGTANNYTTTITMNVRHDGQTPNVAGPQLLTQPLQFKAIANTGLDSSAITVAYLTSDATP